MFIGKRLDDFITGLTQTADQVKALVDVINLAFKFIFTARLFEYRVLDQRQDITNSE